MSLFAPVRPPDGLDRACEERAASFAFRGQRGMQKTPGSRLSGAP